MVGAEDLRVRGRTARRPVRGVCLCVWLVRAPKAASQANVESRFNFDPTYIIHSTFFSICSILLIVFYAVEKTITV